MRRICIGFQGLVLVLAIVYLFPQRALAQAPSSIQILMPGGATPSRAIRMTLVRDDGYINIVFTDSKGTFQIETPKTQSTNSSNYTVTIESDSLTYDTTTVNFRVDPGNPGQSLVFLKPFTGGKPHSSGVLDVAGFEGNVPAPARSAYKRAMESISTGGFESAIGGLQQAISLYPEYLRALNDLGVIYLKLDRLDEAAATFRRAIDINKRFFHPRMNLGIVLSKQGKYKEAVEILEPLYTENHGMLEVRLAYADALMGAGDLAGAEKVCRATLESRNLSVATRASLLFKLGLGLSRQRRFAEAAVEFENAIALDPDVANSHLQLGAALMQLQHLERAERELLRSYELGGHAAGAAQLLLGHIYAGQRKLGDAQRAFEQYLKDMPAAPNASQVAQLIADLKATPKN